MFKQAYALIVGISDYKDQNANLHCAGNDAEAIYAELIDRCGFKPGNIRLLLNENANKNNILDSFRWLSLMSGANEEKDTVSLIYYSGHGGQDEGDNVCYFCPHETDFYLLGDSVIQETEFSDALNKIGGNLAVILDACHADGLANIRKGVDGKPSRNIRAGFPKDYYERLVSNRELERVVIAAARIEQPAIEITKLSHGVFTYYLLESLKAEWESQRKGRTQLSDEISVDLLTVYYGARTMLANDPNYGDQIPVLSGHVSRFPIGGFNPKNHSEMQFANRQYELGEIQRVDGPVYSIIDAPAGYGKTRLVRKAEEWYDKRCYETMTDDLWLCVTVDLGRFHYRSDIIKVLINSLERKYENSIEEGPGSASDAGLKSNTRKWDVSELAKTINKQNAHVLMIFDGCELNPDAVKWLNSSDGLKDLQVKLTGQMKNAIRVIFAGRYIFGNKSLDWPSVAIPMRLSNFDIPVVANVLRKDECDSARCEIIASEIVFLSGGHPGVIEALVRAAKDEMGLAFDLSKGHFLDSDRKSLFEHCQSSFAVALAEVLNTADINIRGLLNFLWVFRFYNTSTVRVIEKLCAQSAASEIRAVASCLANHIYPSSLNLFGALVKIGLIVRKDLGYVDGPVRNLLLVKSYFDQRDDYSYYLQLQSLAFDVYNHLITNTNPDPEYVPNYLRERFYHSICKTQMIKKDMEKQEVWEDIKKELAWSVDLLKKSLDPDEYISKFSDLLCGDSEICSRLKELVGHSAQKSLFEYEYLKML